MVEILSPPPNRPASPLFYELPAQTEIIRIFDPTRHSTQALTFRCNGPRHRFDHQEYPLENPQDDSERGIYYAAFALSSCLVESFGDIGVIEVGHQRVALVTLTRTLKLLDLLGSGAMRAGSVAALAKVPNRKLSQEWSRYFYRTYQSIDGILYANAHNDEKAIALYERARDGLLCPEEQVMDLSDPSLRPAIQQAAEDNNLIFVP